MVLKYRHIVIQEQAAYVLQMRCYFVHLVDPFVNLLQTTIYCFRTIQLDLFIRETIRKRTLISYSFIYSV
jgi:hypothetical protein